MPSQRVQSGLIGVMSGARDGNLDHQVRGEPESIAGSGGPPLKTWSLGSSGQRVGIALLVADLAWTPWPVHIVRKASASQYEC